MDKKGVGNPPTYSNEAIVFLDDFLVELEKGILLAATKYCEGEGRGVELFDVQASSLFVMEELCEKLKGKEKEEK